MRCDYGPDDYIKTPDEVAEMTLRGLCMLGIESVSDCRVLDRRIGSENNELERKWKIGSRSE